MDKDSNQDQIDEALRLLIQASRAQKMDFIQFIALLYERYLDGGNDQIKKVKEIASSVNRSAHEKPWIYVATAVLGGFIAGLFWRRRE